MHFGPIENEQKLIFLHISIYLTLQFFLQNALSYSPLAWMTSKYHHNVFISQIFSGNLTPLLQKLSLKSLSETEISNQDGFPSSKYIKYIKLFYMYAALLL